MSRKKLSNEVKLMLYCVRTKIDASLKCQIQELLQAPLDWNQLIGYSHYHEILPLVYYNLNKIYKQNIPEPIFTILKNSYYATLAKNMYLWREFCYIQDAFNKTGIKVIPLKGIILAETLYHNLGLRPMVDIDILVQEKDLYTAKNELLQLGYKIYLKDLPEDYWRKYHCHFQFHNLDKNILLELHWAFAPPRPNKIDLSLIWKRSRPQLIDHTEILTLTPEDTLFSLCFHICRDIFNLQHLELKELCDIHELITQYNPCLDWDYIMDKVASWRIRGNFLYLYLLTKRYLGTPWPTNISTKLCSKTIPKLILNFSILKLKKLSRLHAISLMLIMLDTILDRLSLCLQGISILLHKSKFFILNFKR